MIQVIKNKKLLIKNKNLKNQQFQILNKILQKNKKVKMIFF